MGVAFVLVMLVYATGLLFLTRKWVQLPISEVEQAALHRNISVIIPARNEADNIERLLTSIEQQDYPQDYFEVIVVDDYSTDSTNQLVTEFISRSSMNLKILKSVAGEGSPKKRAIQQAIGSSTGEVMVTTDGDCLVGTNWLSRVNQAFDTEDVRLVMGPVVYETSSLMDRLQWVEFSALQGVSAVLLDLGMPAMGNGANLAYLKSAFKEVDGFEGNMGVASGDDEFLVRKVASKYGTQALNYGKSVDSVVRTTPARGASAIINQKVRWSSKWKQQSGMASWTLPLLVLLINILPLLGLIAYSAGFVAFDAILAGWVLKGIGDASFAQSAASFFDRKHRISDLIITEIIYPVYVLFFGIASIFGKYTWKDRRYNE